MSVTLDITYTEPKGNDKYRWRFVLDTNKVTPGVFSLSVNESDYKGEYPTSSYIM